jgi:hypothetical protein
MKRVLAVLSFVVCVFLTTSSQGEGMLYHLPADGTWAKFELVGKGIEPDGKETNLSATQTISSVGMTDVDGQKCRWIEIAVDGKRNDQAFTHVDKLLIPEKFLVKGEEPLTHVLKAWRKHSLIGGGAALELNEVQNPESRDGKYVRGDTRRQFLHGPFDAPQKLDKALVESKLGKLECEGISAHERTTDRVTLDSRYVIRLHRDAPFGVVTWEAEMKLDLNGNSLGTMTTKATLSDFGKDAKSAIPEAK